MKSQTQTSSEVKAVGAETDSAAAVDSDRIYLSAPHLSGYEMTYIEEAFRTNWVAPLGPNVEAFESEFCRYTGAPYAVALSSGTAALHLALSLLGVEKGDEVIISSLTFVASANPVLYLGARPVFIDSERASWNMDPNLLEEELSRRARKGGLPKAVVVVHLYGQSADLNRLGEICARYGVPMIEDAAEALGARHQGRSPGTLGRIGFFSFNGNKMITTSGGGMLVTEDGALATRARKLSTQAREPAPHYEHREVGYNYRLSNICAGIGRGQLRVLDERVKARRAVFDYYVEALGDLPGITFMPEAPWGTHSRWLTTLTLDNTLLGLDAGALPAAFEARNIEVRPVWKPLHMQPLFAGAPAVGGDVSQSLFETGICLPSSSFLQKNDLDRVVDTFRTLLIDI